MSKQIGRVALAILVTLALSLGLTAAAGSATASTASASACASERAQVVTAKKQVKKDKKKLKAAKKHHKVKAAKKAKKKLKRDRKKLARAKAAYSACLNRPAPSGGSTGGTDDASADPVAAQCLEVAGQLAAQDPTGQLAGGATAFCDLLGELAASAGGDPTAVCDQLAANDPTGQLGQICDALGGGIPGAPAVPGLPELPGTDGGLLGSTLEGLCEEIAAQDPTGQLQPLCSGLGSLPI